ncbi:MAG: hypothetical protein M3Y87_31345 [Myxococcota bacterium]|nr:hypothetical protein [Myxococcota bacterium]
MMRSRSVIVLASALVALASGCGGDGVDPADAAMGPVDARVERGDAEVVDAQTIDADGIDAAGTDAARDAGAASACDDGVRSGTETDVDCGGACAPCRNGQGCVVAGDCLSARCEESACASPPGTHPDIVRVIDVVGRDPGGGWSDSYSVGAECYCESSFDHAIGDIVVSTPAGPRTVREVCDALGPGPGSAGRPLYNDIQCGNGPANDAGDEDDCPGRVDIGREGCGHLGPTWDLSVFAE